MVFLVRLLGFPSISTSSICVEDAQDVEAITEELQKKTGIPSGVFRLEQNGRPLRSLADLPSPSVLTALPSTGLKGGKGGFGSMLRALGAQIEKTTNREACRDLSGRRLRDINEEERLKQYVSRRADREREAAEKREEKMRKLRRLAEGENKHEFHDPDYIRQREEATDRVHEAMAHVAAQGKEGEKKEATLDSDEGCSTSEPKPGPSGIGSKRKAEERKAGAPEGKKRKPKDIWVGVELSDSDLESSDEEEEDGSSGEKEKSG